MSSSTNPIKRLYILAALLSVWFAVICFRLVRLQIVHYKAFQQMAAKQQEHRYTLPPIRGIIYDARGNDLAESISLDSVFAVPSEIPDVHSTAEILAGILHAKPDEIEGRILASHAFAWIERKVDAGISARIRALNLKGIHLQQESKRFYPKGELAAQVLGYVGLDNDGLGGIERQFEGRLKGKPGTMLVSMDARRQWLSRAEKDPDPGENIVLTLDEKIQYIAERELEQAIRDTHAEAGTIIVENPRTGAVLALANRPTFNPNRLNAAPAEALNNRAVSDIYEPGSTFKLVTLAGALEEKIITPDEVFDCQMGSIMVEGLRIHDHHAYGNLTVRQILEHSSDVGAIKVALRLGKDRFDHYIHGFGFGSQTGIELPRETRGLAKPASRWSKVSIGAIAMGQEIGVSPVQLIAMLSTMANDGMYVSPRIIMGTTAPRSTPQLVAFHPVAGRRVISPLTAAQMRQMMEGVVLRGTGTRAAVNGYSVAGKTGTAQKIDPTTHAYSRSKYIASFGGFAPINNPAVTILVVLDSPVGLHEGGEVAAPVFSRVAQQVLAYLNVPHDREIQTPKVLQARQRHEDVTESAAQRVEEAEQFDQQPAPVPQAVPAVQTEQPEIRTVAQASSCGTSGNSNCPSSCGTAAPGCIPPSPAPTTRNGSVVLDANGGVVVPAFTGKSLRAALEEAEEAGIELEASGSGIAQSQSPAAGSHIPHGGRVSVRFGR